MAFGRKPILKLGYLIQAGQLLSEVGVWCALPTALAQSLIFAVENVAHSLPDTLAK